MNAALRVTQMNAALRAPGDFKFEHQCGHTLKHLSRSFSIMRCTGVESGGECTLMFKDPQQPWRVLGTKQSKQFFAIAPAVTRFSFVSTRALYKMHTTRSLHLHGGSPVAMWIAVRVRRPPFGYYHRPSCGYPRRHISRDCCLSGFHCSRL
jgi:hypothetical protein